MIFLSKGHGKVMEEYELPFYSMLVAILPCRVRGAVSNHTAPLA